MLDETKYKLLKLVFVAVLAAAFLASAWQAVIPKYFDEYKTCTTGCHTTKVLDHYKINHPLWCVDCHGFGAKSEILPGIPFIRYESIEEGVSIHGECLLCHRVPGAFHEVHLEEGLRCTECHQNAYHGHHTDKPKSNTCIKCHKPSEVHPELAGSPAIQTCTACHGEPLIMNRDELLHSNLAASSLGSYLGSTLYSYTGLTGCRVCHNPAASSQAHAMHKGVSCTSCHTSSLPHGSAEARSSCLSCHRSPRLHEFLVEKHRDVACSQCHTGWKQGEAVKPLKACSTCHGGEFVEQVKSYGLHFNHAGIYSCDTCHSGNTHEEYLEVSKDKCLVCHDASGNLLPESGAPGSLVSPPPNHAEIAAAANGNCIACHSNWAPQGLEAKLVLGGEP